MPKCPTYTTCLSLSCSFILLIGATSPLSAKIPEPPQGLIEWLKPPDPIPGLLKKAQTAYAKNRLTHPEDDNASLYIQQILAIQQNQPEALALLTEVIKKYQDWAKTDIEQANYVQAQKYLSKSQGLISREDQVLLETEQSRLENQLKTAQQQLIDQKIIENQQRQAQAALQQRNDRDKQTERENQLKTDSPEMVKIQGGIFTMGCVSGIKCYDDEKPLNKGVKITTFWLGKYEVSNQQYVDFLNQLKHAGSGINSNWLETDDQDSDSHILLNNGH